MSTPGYTPRDVDMGAFEKAMQQHASPGAPNARGVSTRPVELMTTSAGHIAGATNAPPSTVKMRKDPDSEVTLDGNSVVVEEQMMKWPRPAWSLKRPLIFIPKSLGLLRLAIKSPS